MLDLLGCSRVWGVRLKTFGTELMVVSRALGLNCLKL